MGRIDRHRHIKRLHRRDAKHVDDKVIISKARAPLTENGRVAFVTCHFGDLGDDVLAIPRRQELGFFDMQPTAARNDGLCAGNDKIGLTAEESRHLDDLRDLSNRSGLLRRVIVGYHGHAKLCLDVSQNAKPFLKAGAAIGIDRGAVRLVEARLEDIGQTETITDCLEVLADAHREIAALQNIQARHHRQGVARAYRYVMTGTGKGKALHLATPR